MLNSGLFLFLLVVFSNILISGSFLPFLYITVAVLHEGGHILMLKSLKHPVKKIRFVGLGIEIKQQSQLSYRDNLLVSLSGPVVSAFAGIVFLVLSKIFLSYFLYELSMANYMYALLNLLPLPPLDGYAVLSDTVFMKCSLGKAELTLRSVLLVMVILLLLFCGGLLFFEIYNFSLILIILLLIFNAVIKVFSI